MVTPVGKRWWLHAIAALLAGLGALMAVQSWSWWGAAFPGFFLMPNRVVPSAGLPGWAGAPDGRPVFQQVLVAVDGSPVATATAGYDQARHHSIGEVVQYDLAGAHGVERRTFPLRRLTGMEYGGIFGAYFLTGLAYLTLAVVAGRRWHADPRLRAFTVFGWAGAAFTFSAMDLYGAGTFFRLHAAAETLLLAACVHLVVVWPRNRWFGEADLVRLVYGAGGMFALAYQAFLYDPRGYATCHNICQGLMAAPTLLLAAQLALGARAAATVAEAQVLRRLLDGALVGFVGPGLIFGLSSLAGGDVPVSTAAWLNFVFPLAAAASLGRLEAFTGSAVSGPPTAARETMSAPGRFAAAHLQRA